MGQPLGQHFLRDASVARFMVEAAGLSGRETVLEIGPGKGTITRLLAKEAGRVIAVEKDRSLAPHLQGLPENVEVVWGDVLELWPECDALVSNLPFYISSEVLYGMPAVPAVLGVQEEFADKMVARPGDGDYGRLSVSARLRFQVEPLRTYPPSVFSPPPKVSLTVVRLSPRDPADWEAARELVRDMFSHKNKKVDNALEAAGREPLGIDKRVRELTPAEAADIARRVK